MDKADGSVVDPISFLLNPNFNKFRPMILKNNDVVWFFRFRIHNADRQYSPSFLSDPDYECPLPFPSNNDLPYRYCSDAQY
jgi:hypothetical protein